jgi:hypothetical protein
VSISSARGHFAGVQSIYFYFHEGYKEYKGDAPNRFAAGASPDLGAGFGADRQCAPEELAKPPTDGASQRGAPKRPE